MLAGCSLLGTWVMLWHERRFWRPDAHVRLLVWSVSFIFVALPAMIVSALPGIVPLDRFGVGELSFLLPESVRSQQWWVRGQLDYERWLASRMKEDLEISWQDDRGGEKRAVNNWDCLLYTSPSPRDRTRSRMPSSA